jgi:hypothetical protein
MSKIVQIKPFALTDPIEYVKARNQAEKLSQEHGLIVADMPMVIHAMTTHPEVREAIRPYWIDTITGEYHGQRDGNRSYETWHSAGTLATAKGLEQLFKQVGNYTFMPISDDEWTAVGNGNYNGQTIARVHLEDARKSKVPAPGTPYTIFVRLDKDKPTINARGQLNYDTFMQDDRILMITGSPESREALAKMLFGKKEDGEEGWSTIGSYHRINIVDFDKQAKGRLTCLGDDYGGLGGYDVDYGGRFVVVGAVRAKNASPAGIAQPTLEQTLAIINNPNLNREGMIKAVIQLYRQ